MTPLSLLRKRVRGVHVLELDVEIVAEDALHGLRFVRAQQAVVDEDAGELVADGLVQQRRRDAGIHAAAQAENDVLVADLLRGSPRRLLDETAHRPVHRAAADVVDESSAMISFPRGVWTTSG